MTHKLLLLALVLATVACTVTTVEIDTTEQTTDLESTQALKSFSSAQEIQTFLKENSQQQTSGNFFGFDVMEDSVAAPMVRSAEAGVATQANDGGSTKDFSGTNVQVEGVDEADFVKNDGKYIYTLTSDKLVIFDAFPAESADIVSETKIDGNPHNLFVNDDRLVVFTRDYTEILMIPQYGFAPIPRSTSITRALVYDISDRENIELVKDYEVTGSYHQARMIGDHVYFITQENIWWYNDIVAMPAVRESGTMLIEPQVFYFDNPEHNYGFSTVASFDIQSNENSIDAKSYMLGHGSTVFVSQDNIYVAYQKNQPWHWYQDNEAERFFDVVVPLLPREVQNEIEVVTESDMNEGEQWDSIELSLQTMYNNMEKSEQRDLIENIAEAVTEYDIQQEIKLRKTIVHKIAIDEGSIDYVTSGEVSGHVLNQFSMDEHEGNFRIATSTVLWRGERRSFNNVFVLDEDLEHIGELTDIAPGETIFSTRFMGDRLYMVTFERVDPFFVIDLSNPTSPEILGELKIPGFSDYLHPFDENHVIGVGKQTEDNRWGGVSIKGVKIALFDVIDVSNPTIVDQVEIGDRGTDSEVLNDHKAFLFDKDKELMVLPIREVIDDNYYDPVYRYRRWKYWQGAYVFTVTEDGFSQRGKITHNENDIGDRYYYSSPTAVRRSLYMDDVLYTVSEAKIMMHDIESVEEINDVDLPYSAQKYPEPYYGGEIEIMR